MQAMNKMLEDNAAQVVANIDRGRIDCIQWAILLVLGLLDLTVMAAYIKMGLSKGIARRYGRVKIVVHTVAGLGLLVPGFVALVSQAPGWLVLAESTRLILGLTAVANGFGALALAPYTSGVEGYNWCGYSAYSVKFIQSGVHVLRTPIAGNQLGASTSGVSLAYQCLVVAHAYLMCRLFVRTLNEIFSSFLDERMRYSVGTTLAAGFTLFLVYGTPGLQPFFAMVACSLALNYVGAGPLVHVNLRKPTRVRANALRMIPSWRPMSSLQN